MGLTDAVVAALAGLDLGCEAPEAVFPCFGGDALCSATSAVTHLTITSRVAGPDPVPGNASSPALATTCARA